MLLGEILLERMDLLNILRGRTLPPIVIARVGLATHELDRPSILPLDLDGCHDTRDPHWTTSDGDAITILQREGWNKEPLAVEGQCDDHVDVTDAVAGQLDIRCNQDVV